MRLCFRRALLAAVVLLLVPWAGFAAVVVRSADDLLLIRPPVYVPRGQSVRWVAPQHAPGDGFDELHYFAMTGDVHHFAWFDSEPSDPAPIVIKYDYRGYPGYPNMITPEEILAAELALAEWTRATGCKVRFERDQVAPEEDIIIGTGDLAALGFVSGEGGILGLGGGDFNHVSGAHTITGGVAWLDYLDAWDTTVGNGDPVGTFDYFTVMAQEVGHAIGLGHTNNVPGPDLMDGTYGGEITSASATDIDHIRSVYGAEGCPIFEDGFETGDKPRWSASVP